jgi:glutathione S-transferase
MRLYDYGPSPNCHKVRILLAQLGREYERVPTDIFGGDTLEPDYMEKNSGLTTPVLEVEPGVYIPESGAILLYLAEGRRAPVLRDDGAARPGQPAGAPAAQVRHRGRRAGGGTPAGARLLRRRPLHRRRTRRPARAGRSTTW